jgi:hypothetical protein
VEEFTGPVEGMMLVGMAAIVAPMESSLEGKSISDKSA